MFSAPGPTPLAAFAAEAASQSAVLATLTEAEFDRPTRCAPWTARALLAHVAMGADRVITMLTEPTPSAADTDAAGYYRPDKRFSSVTNRERVDTRHEAPFLRYRCGPARRSTSSPTCRSQPSSSPPCSPRPRMPWPELEGADKARRNRPGSPMARSWCRAVSEDDVAVRHIVRARPVVTEDTHRATAFEGYGQAASMVHVSSSGGLRAATGYDRL